MAEVVSRLAAAVPHPTALHLDAALRDQVFVLVDAETLGWLKALSPAWPRLAGALLRELRRADEAGASTNATDGGTPP